MLELNELTKSYPSAGGDRVLAADGVSLELGAGEFVALYGPSGSGKTTLLMLIAALLAPDSGSVRFNGRDVLSLTAREAAAYRLHELGFVRQSLELTPGVSAVESAGLKLVACHSGLKAAERAVLELFERLGISERASHHTEQLSRGERQRVAIARALSTKPQLLLADEPTGSLDSRRGDEVLALLRDLCRERGVAVLLVTHDHKAADYADRALVLRDGHLLEGDLGGTATALRTSPEAER